MGAENCSSVVKRLECNFDRISLSSTELHLHSQTPSLRENLISSRTKPYSFEYPSKYWPKRYAHACTAVNSSEKCYCSSRYSWLLHRQLQISCERYEQATALSYRNKICRPQNCGCDRSDHGAINANMGSLNKCHVLTLPILSAVAVIYCPVITRPYFSCFSNIYEDRHNVPFNSHLSTILLCEVLDSFPTKMKRAKFLEIVTI